MEYFFGTRLFWLSAGMASAQTSGPCGDGLTYAITGTAPNLTLTISKTGTGTVAMTDYTTGTAPWYGQRANIKTLVINSGVTSISNNAFSNCIGLTTINIAVISIGDFAFNSCSNITGTLTIPNSVTTIGRYVFQGCSGLTTVTIPASVTSIGEKAFYICSDLTAINVDAGNPNYSSDSGVLFNKGKTTLILYPRQKTGTFYTIPNSVILIEPYAFEGCKSLTSITIPNSVTTIRNYAFWGCINLKSVTISSSVTTIGDWAFDYCNALTSVTNLRATPQVINANVFSNYTNATLSVSSSAAVAAYSAATARLERF